MRFGRVTPYIMPIGTVLPMIDPICSAVLLCGAIWPLRPMIEPIAYD
jgi:hypothetical protein